MKIEKSTFQFLTTLAKNNNRDWFTKHKTKFTTIQNEVKQFYKSVREDLEKHDEIEKHKFFRIYRDVRFSKDKTPYKTHFSGSYSRKGKHLRGGYYLQMSSKKSFLAGGFWEPDKEDLFRIRKELETDASEFKKVINEPHFIKYFGNILQGDELKTAPKGFDKTHPDINLIRKKDYIAVRNFTDKEVLSSTFLKEIDASYRALRSFFNLMSLILTTNLNGESLLE